jgi:gluconolactonase
MRRGRGLAWGVLAGLAVVLAGPARADDKGVIVNFSGLKSRAPANWKEETPANKMRFAQFSLPKVKGDSEDGELVIFKGLGGSAKQNIERWKGLFTPPAGKKIDDVAKVKEITVGGNANEGSYLDISGTYKFNPMPFNPRSKTVNRPGYRMLALHLSVKIDDDTREVYHVRLTGPAKTVAHYKAGYDAWLKGFKN